jgi:glycosyltransferase involved in cell wall biosynthesis
MRPGTNHESYPPAASGLGLETEVKPVRVQSPADPAPDPEKVEVKVAHLSSLASFLQIFLLQQMRDLKRAGYALLGVSSPGPEAEHLTAEGIGHVAVPLTRTITPLRDLVSLWRLYRAFRRERPAVVHTHNPKPGLIGQLAARLAGVPVVVNTVHGFYLHEDMHWLARRIYLWMEKAAARCSDVILSQNREDMETAIREGICPPEKILLLGNGIDLSAFDPARFPPDLVRQRRRELGIPAGAFVVGFVGRLAARRKGFLDFLRAGEELVRAGLDVHFLIVGDADRGKPDSVDPEVIGRSAIGGRAHFLGTRPPAEMPGLYPLMDVLVLPSSFEGLPRAIMEAAAMGRPSVATDVKGNREAVEHGQTGLLVPLGDVPALAAALRTLVCDPERAAALGEAARLQALERFDERLVFDRIRAEYTRLLQAKGLPVPAPWKTDVSLEVALAGG